VHAWHGLVLAARGRNFRVQTVVALLVLLAGAYYRVSPTQWTVLVLCIFAVLALEAMNTALERLADRVSPAHDPLIGQAKDLAAAAVLLAALGAASAGLVIFLPHLMGDG
jgi:diacylglycerol kinase